MSILELPTEILLKTLKFTNKKGTSIILHIKDRDIKLFMWSVVCRYKMHVNVMELSKLIMLLKILNKHEMYDEVDDIWDRLNPIKKNRVLWKYQYDYKKNERSCLRLNSELDVE